jgi:predicted amidophosphoribosyltransferase
MPPHIFPTDIVPVPDAGGGPVRNQQGAVLGILARNISTSSSYVYGIHIASIRRCLEMYQYELRSVTERVYCVSCGYASAAVAAGGYYCETCGTLMPQAREQAQGQSPRMAALYDENSHPACTSCGAKFGFYEGMCLRCGQAGDPGGQRAQAVEY